MSLYFDIIRHISAYGGVNCQGLSPLPRLGRQAQCFKGKPVFFICALIFYLLFSSFPVHRINNKLNPVLCMNKEKHRLYTKIRIKPVFMAERVGFEPTCPCGPTVFECCKTLADSRLEQVVPGRIVKSRKPRHRKEFRTFRPVSARGDLKCPRVQIKLRSCVKSRRSCAFARSQARKQRPRQHR